MASPFAAALAQMDERLDEHMGEAIAVTPMRAGDFGTTADPDRPAFTVKALVDYVDPSAADVGKLQARLVYSETVVEIRRAVLAGRRLRKNDEIVLVEQSGTPRLKISRVDDVDPERLFVTLARLTPGEE